MKKSKKKTATKTNSNVTPKVIHTLLESQITVERLTVVDKKATYQPDYNHCSNSSDGSDSDSDG